MPLSSGGSAFQIFISTCWAGLQLHAITTVYLNRLRQVCSWHDPVYKS